MATISVIIPTYNVENFILETIESVIQQTFSDFEIIVINDGSTDRTLELLNTIKDPRLKIFSYENAGVSVARNRGIARATGEFIAFLDSDDLWTSDKLELQITALQQRPEAGVAYSWTCCIDEQGKFMYHHEKVSFEGKVYPQLLVKNFFGCGSIPLIRKQAIESVGTFNSSLVPVEDWDYWLRLAERWHFVLVPKTQIFYRKLTNSLSSKPELMKKSFIQVHENAFKVAQPELQFLKNQSLANIYEFLAYLSLANIPGQDGAKLASQELQMAVKLNPKLLLNRKTQRLAMKLVLMQFISRRIAKHFTGFFSIIFPDQATKAQKLN
jgi:glycosyltransferase involved in cell wall biosynthesis